jgi:hypothetical protein
MSKKNCFVVMGFGKKVDFETGKEFDLDMTYKNVIKPAVEAAGVECVRADEITHAGVIDVPMYERILEADLVIADISTGNRNAIYELGVRHALRPHTTIIIGEDSNTKIPFDLNHIVIRKYRHLGEDIGATEARRVSTELTKAIKELLAAVEPKADSPVYTFIPRLQTPGLASAVPVAAAASTLSPAAPPQPNETHGAMMTLAREAQAREDFATAKSLLSSIVTLIKSQAPDRPVDATILQQLALVTYKSKQPSALEALRAACAILADLEPDTTNDTETLGLWGAVHKRLWQLNRDRTSLDGALRALERGFFATTITTASTSPICSMSEPSNRPILRRRPRTSFSHAGYAAKSTTSLRPGGRMPASPAAISRATESIGRSPRSPKRLWDSAMKKSASAGWKRPRP